jgi:hypothetical protein
MARVSRSSRSSFLMLTAVFTTGLLAGCGSGGGSGGGTGGSAGSGTGGAGTGGRGGSGTGGTGTGGATGGVGGSGTGGSAGGATGTGGSGTGGAGGSGTGGSGTGGTGGGGAGGTGGSPADGGRETPPSSGGPGIPAACRAMVDAANAFIMTIQGEPAKRSAAVMGFAMRRHFKYTPGTRPGLTLGQMSMPQRDAAMALVKTGLSDAGYTKAEQIRMLELVLRAMEGSNTRDPLGYYVAIYGTPAADGDWAWHWEGHHLSLHYTLSKCTAIADAPSFFGTNPARVGTNVPMAPPVGTRPLGKEEDLARALAMALSADSGKSGMAIVANQLREVQDSPAKVSPATPAGLAASAMSPAEQDQLKGVVAEFAQNMSADVAAARLKRIQDADFSKVSFLWSGSLMPNQAHYFRIQGPTFLIEYLNQQNNANHVHSVWRDFNGDFGEDLLMLHLKQYPH